MKTKSSFAVGLATICILVSHGASLEAQSSKAHVSKLVKTRSPTASRSTKDPLLDALAEHESRHQAGAVGGRDGQCIGLTQICLHDMPACKTGFDAPECVALKQRLLNPNENLRVARDQLNAWRRYCKRVVGRADVRGIIFGFAGADGHSVHCGKKRASEGSLRWVDAKTPKVVREILAIYERKLQERRRTTRHAR